MTRLPKSALIVALFMLLVAGVVCAAPTPTSTPKPAAKIDGQPTKKAEFAKKAPGESYTVYQIDLHEDIMGSDVPFFVHRAIVAAKAAKADAVVLDLDTNGGRLDLMMQIRDDLIELKIPTYAYVNTKAISAGALIAIAMDTIVMSPHSTIGGAQAITATGQGLDETVGQKVDSIMRAQVRATAQYKGHPATICEAFVDRNVDIPGLTTKGQVLTMDPLQATTFVDPKTSKTLAAFIAKDMDELLKHEKISPARRLTYEMTWSEKLAKFLMSIKAILLLVGLGAIFIEIKSPGLGAPAAVGIVALALFFWSSYLADLANFLDVGLFVLGLLLLIVEIFIIPGFGLAGVAGVSLIVISLIMAMFKLPPPDVPGLTYNVVMLNHALLTIVIVFVAFIPLAWIVGRVLPHAPIFRNLILNPEVVNTADAATAGTISRREREDQQALIGATGTALTDLRPAGMAQIAGRRLDVTTEGDYISIGEAVRVTAVQGNVHVVVRASANSA